MLLPSARTHTSHTSQRPGKKEKPCLPCGQPLASHREGHAFQSPVVYIYMYRERERERERESERASEREMMLSPVMLHTDREKLAYQLSFFFF